MKAYPLQDDDGLLHYTEDSDMIPTDAQERKDIPVYSGFFAYFPLAICEVAKHSQRSNEQHNPGEPLRWDRAKSTDELDSLGRHLLGTAVSESYEEELEHARAVAWRAMANLQKLCEKAGVNSVTSERIENSKPQKIATTEPVVGEYESLGAADRRDRIIAAAREKV